MPTSQPLRGKAAFVTGATRGIGLAIAERLVSHGADVMITGRTDEHARQARERLMAAGRTEKHPRVEVKAADVRDCASVEQAINDAVDRFGGLDILVNNAGIGTFAEVAAQPLDDWRS